MSCPPPPPIVDNSVALAQVSTAFGTGPTCESNGGGAGYSFLFGLISAEVGVKSSKGCSAIAKQLSYLSQANTIAACQLNRSSTNSSQTSVVINTIDFINGPGGQVLCGSGGFNVSNVTSVDFTLSVSLDIEATQSVANTANLLIQNLLTAKAESIEGYLATSDGAQTFQAAITDTQNYVQSTNVNDTYVNMFQSTDTTNIIRITNYGIITGESCNITNSNLNTLAASQLMQTLANQSASQQSVIAFNNSFDAYASAQAKGLDSLGGTGGLIGIIIVVVLIIIVLAVVGYYCRTGTCNFPKAKKQKPEEEKPIKKKKTKKPKPQIEAGASVSS